ncbi:MAG: pitrilysin family protein [Pirellulales bacterium]
MRRFLSFMAGVCLAMPLAAAADAEKIVTVEGVTEYRLSNGARVLLLPEQSRPTVSVNMTVLVGSRHEGYGEAGMAHLLEHLVFKGTPTFPNVPKSLRDHGANFNGTTNSDRTNYFETLPATDENLEFAIQLESDRLVNSFIRREDLISEFSVVRNEFERGENNPRGVLSQRVQAAAFEWHNYGKSTIGNRSDIERVPIDNLQAFYRRFYQPDNVVLIVTGRFEEQKALALVEKYLGSIPKPTRKLDATYTEEPPQDGERNVVLRRVGKVGAVDVVYHMPAAAHPDWAPLSILASVLNESKVGRLDAALVETKLATSASAGSDNSHDPGLFSFSAEPGEASLEAVRDKLLEVIENMGDKPFEAEEVERAKLRAKRGSEMMLTSAQSMSQALSSASSLGDWRLLFLQRDRVQQVTADDVNRVAKTYFKSYNRTVGLYIPVEAPQRLSVPAVESIADVVKDYKGDTKVSIGEAFDPTPANIDARTKVVEFEGLKIALLPKKNRGDTVNLTLTLRYGNEESLAGKVTAAGMVGSMLMAGTKQLDRQALQEQLNKIGVQIFPGGGGGGGRRGSGRGGRGGGGGAAGQLSFSIQAKRESLVQGIQLLGEILRDPAFPADEFDQMKLRSISGLSSRGNDPNSLAGDKLGKALSSYPPSDVRFVPTTEETLKEIEKVTLEDVIQVYREQVSAATGEIAIVGDFDPDTAVAAVTDILKEWKSSVPFKPYEREARGNLQGSKETIVTPDNANAVFLAGLSFALNEKDPDSTALELGNFILGGGTLSSRLGDRIRQKEGLTYGVNSSVSVPTRGNDARFTITATTNPGNMEAVEKAAFEELKQFIVDGPTKAEVDDAKKAFLEAAKVSRTGDAAIAGQLASNLFLGRTFAYIAEQEARIEALQPKDIQAAFAKYIDPEKLTVIRAGDLPTK